MSSMGSRELRVMHEDKREEKDTIQMHIFGIQI
jgi:hypothetical protein